MSENRLGIGQHRTGSVGTGNNGQRQVRGTAGDVGMEGGGERQNGPVPGSVDADLINTTCGAEDTPFYDSVVRRKG
jgi:hypothetical protein